MTAAMGNSKTGHGFTRWLANLSKEKGNVSNIDSCPNLNFGCSGPGPLWWFSLRPTVCLAGWAAELNRSGGAPGKWSCP
jgi:hypothetical protein